MLRAALPHDPIRQWTHRLASDPKCPVSAKRNTGLKDLIQAIAKRIVAYPLGNFDPSPPPRVLETITDANLDVALEVASAVGAEVKPKPLSGTAEHRLLAWMVADARGATVVLDPPSAERVGKRLKKQALKVRDDLAAVPDWAESERASTRAAADADAALRPQLRADLAAIDTAEQRKLQAPHEEVYIGFHELDKLELRVMPTDATDGGPDGPAGVRLPSVLEPLPQSVPIPPDLAELVGADGCSALMDAREHAAILRADDWWTWGLTSAVGHLLGKLAAQEARHASERAYAAVLAQVAAATGQTRQEDRLSSANEATADALARVASLEAELLRAQGREAALYEVIVRLKGLREGADTS
ncbi:hypothetical protein OAO87_03375 [bacterium]|nr:hypothetical protein [bacterium]